MPRTNRYSPEVRERAIRMVAEHRDECLSEWAAFTSIAAKLGMTAWHPGRSTELLSIHLCPHSTSWTRPLAPA